jgi:cell fate regulator YaaT (PSP1 superfamily)
MVQLPISQGMLSTYDWMKGLGGMTVSEEVVEVRFKNNRKEFFINRQMTRLGKDDRVVVEAEGGHDLGTVSLAGPLAEKNYHQKEYREKKDLKQIYRKATGVDLEKWLKSKKLEREVLLRARILANQLGLEMKITDCEFRADGKKVTVFYTADGRIDFRELVKLYASEFRVRIEMKQIGVRQGAARVGGLGTCGRELCCSTWKTEMNSVNATAARVQNVSQSTSRLAGQCGKLKCCLNYELEVYLEAWEKFPPSLIELETDRGILVPLQPDVLKGIVYYSFPDENAHTRFVIPIDKVKEYISQNKRGKRVITANIASTSAN